VSSPPSPFRLGLSHIFRSGLAFSLSLTIDPLQILRIRLDYNFYDQRLSKTIYVVPLLIRDQQNLQHQFRSRRYQSRREFLREIQALDGHIQREENVASTFRSFRLCIRGFKVGAGAGGRCIRQAVGKI